jgi:hypothetical protein
MLINLSCVDGPLITVIENTTGMITLHNINTFTITKHTITCNLQTVNAAINTKTGNTDVDKMIAVQI